MGIQIRNYRESDLELIVVLLNAIEAIDHAEEGTTLVEQRELFGQPSFNPEENVFVAEDETGRLVATAHLRLLRANEENAFRTWFNIHPMLRGHGLEDRLLTRLEERARARLSETNTATVSFTSYAHTGYAERLHAIERAGLKEIRRYWEMRHTRLENLPAPHFPPDLRVREYHPGEDDTEAHNALNDAFREHYGHSDMLLENWQHYLHSISYRPDLTVLAIDARTNRIAGFCHIVVNADECQRFGRQRGWIDILGVRPEYRKQGLGEALLVQGMHNLRAAGMVEAVLGCDSQNTTNATRLYFRVGFAVANETILFGKQLREALPTTESTPELAFA